MADKVTLGGNRLGSGEKIQVERHNYGMNSWNLSQDWKSSMAPGILYPCLKLIATNHGTFDIDVDHLVRTIPTQGPLFGSFKMQVDFFNVPIRLYQGILHNNPTSIGMNMNRVYLPKIHFQTTDISEDYPQLIGSNEDNWQVNESSLEKYLGLSGWGIATNYTPEPGEKRIAHRKLQCVPELAYYDIFKCYYANKQEEDAYVIYPGNIRRESKTKIRLMTFDYVYPAQTIEENEPFTATTSSKITFYLEQGTIEEALENILIEITVGEGNEENIINDWLEQTGTPITNVITINDNTFTIYFNLTKAQQYFEEESGNAILRIKTTSNITAYASNIHLKPFELSNIDLMRSKLLKKNEIGEEFVIGYNGDWDGTEGERENGMPYAALFKYPVDNENNTIEITPNAFAQNGLVVKTYQSDIYNNWLNSETIDGLEGVKARTAVDVSGGSFTQDDLILHEKLYEVLNRIAVGDGTYQDWQEANYGEGAVKMCETPMYVGGMSAEVLFDEIISNAETNINGDFQPLGSLGGRGKTNGQRGGTNIHVRFEEPGYLMAIVSLTPRIVYTQGNDWDRTELDSIDDLHKPGLDGIGFQDLIVENFAWWNTVLNANGTIKQRGSAGKQTAWIQYQTAVDKAYGDFAKKEGYNFMVLARNYEHTSGRAAPKYGVRDLTTYIDPAKFNYAFAKTDLASQNFWVQLSFKITARRKMGAQQLPNL